MNYKTTSWFLLLPFVGASMIGLAGYAYFVDRETGELLTVVQPDRELNGLVVGRNYAVTFEVRNTSGEPWRVVGAPLGC